MLKKILKHSQQPVQATVDLPGSKSITNRALLLAALAKGCTTLKGFLLSEDSEAFMAALQALGVSIALTGDVLTVTGRASLQASDQVWCRDAGTAARFLVAACAAFPGEFTVDGTARLRERPLAELVDALKVLGATLDNTQLPCRIQGVSLKGGALCIDASKSTQFVSALLMVAPFMQTPLVLTAENLNRQAYIAITCEMMQAFGVQVSQSTHSHRGGVASVYSVALPQSYQSRDYDIEPDLSTASYFFAAAAVTGGEVTVKRIQRDNCLQGDIRFLAVLEKMGCTVTANEDSVTVNGPKQLKGLEINMQDFSDPFLTLAAIAPYADSPTYITGLAHTRLQESDRVMAIAAELTKLHIKVETGDDWIRIFPGQPKATEVFSHNDHRVAMSLAILALKTPGIQLENPGCVAKTCPNFFALLAGL